MPRQKRDHLDFPAVVLIDSNEQAPYTFTGIEDRNYDGRQLAVVVPTVKVSLRAMGGADYSLRGFEKKVQIERKETGDFYKTVIHERDRFEDELIRLDAIPFGDVIVESEWSTIRTRYDANKVRSLYRSVIAWRYRFRNVHWWFANGRRIAELTTFRLLQRFLKEASHGASNGLEGHNRRDSQPSGHKAGVRGPGPPRSRRPA